MAEPTFPERELFFRDRPTTEKDIAILYQELLGREPPTEAETAASVGKPLLQFAVDLVRSREHVARLRATTSDDVARLYRELLGREPESPAVYANNLGNPLATLVIAIP